MINYQIHLKDCHRNGYCVNNIGSFRCKDINQFHENYSTLKHDDLDYVNNRFLFKMKFQH